MLINQIVNYTLFNNMVLLKFMKQEKTWDMIFASKEMLEKRLNKEVFKDKFLTPYVELAKIISDQSFIKNIYSIKNERKIPNEGFEENLKRYPLLSINECFSIIQDFSSKFASETSEETTSLIT
jgi:hypothetical protein